MGYIFEVCFIVNYGVKGGNGKSIMYEVIVDVCDDFIVIIVFLVFEEKFVGGIFNDIVVFKGVWFVFVFEGNVGKVMDEVKFKSVIGGDCVIVWFFYKENFMFKLNFFLLLVLNNKFVFKG